MNVMIMIMTQVTEKSNYDNARRDCKVKVGAPPTIKVTQGIPLLMMTMMLVMMLTIILILMMMTVMMTFFTYNVSYSKFVVHGQN